MHYCEYLPNETENGKLYCDVFLNNVALQYQGVNVFNNFLSQNKFCPL
jgi:hypothetical protein